MLRFRDIPQFTRSANYKVDHDWAYLESAVARYVEDTGFDMGESEFQRAHVWTEQQQIRFVEYALRGGTSGMDIFTNHPGWMGSFKGRMVLVDGKQRLTAALRFLRGEIPAFGHYRNEYVDKPHGVSFRWHVNDLKTDVEVYRWYLEMNSGGTVHTDEELQKVRDLLEVAEK